jgi:hypothetical protein
LYLWESVVRKKMKKKRSAGVARPLEEPKSYASVYAAKLAKQVAEFTPRLSGTGSRKSSKKKGR